MTTPTIGTQLTIPQLHGTMSQTRIALGALGEQLIAQYLQRAGYAVSTPHERGDLSVVLPTGEILAIEVKTARKSKDGAYRFTLYKYWQGRVCADHSNTNFVILVCVQRSGYAVAFVVPTRDLQGKTAVGITSEPRKYHGWLAPYRQELKKLRLPQ